MSENGSPPEMAPFEASLAALERKDLVRLSAAVLTASIALGSAAAIAQVADSDGAMMLSYIAACASGLLAAASCAIAISAATCRHVAE